MIKLKQILKLLLVVISTVVNAQLTIPTYLGSQKYSAKGMGATGIPTINFTIPVGTTNKNRIIIVTMSSERFHNPTNSNFLVSGDLSGLFDIKINGIDITNGDGYHRDGGAITPTNIQQWAAVAYTYKMPDAMSGTIPITFTNLSLPQSINDEISFIVSVYENVESFQYLSTFSLGVSSTGTAPFIPLGRTASEIMYMVNGAITQQTNLSLSVGWSVDQMNRIDNTQTVNTSIGANEHDGMSHIVGHRNGFTGNPNVTISRIGTVDYYSDINAFHALLPLRSPSITGTVYNDTDGATNINGTATNASGIYINVINDNNILIYSAVVNASGNFNIPTGYVEENSTYRLELSKNTGTVGSSAPLKELPSGWVIVGENATGVTPYPNDGVADGIINKTVGASTISGLRFGIRVCTTNTVTSNATRTACINTALSPNITHTTTGATGIGTATGLPAGLTASFASNTITISGTPTISGTFNYSIPLTGGCGTVNATGTIVVNVSNTATSNATRTACINTALSPNITHTTTGATGIGTATGLPAGLTASFASNTITISGTPTISGTFNYSIPLTGGCGTVNATGTIVVNSCLPPSTITDITCSNNGTFENSNDDFLQFKITPTTNTSNYSLTATYNGSPVLVNQLDNSAATNIMGGLPSYFKVANGTLPIGNDFVVTITPTTGTPETLTFTNTGTCSTACTSASSGNTVTYYYYSPVIAQQDSVIEPASLPKFDQSNGRLLTNVSIEYGANYMGGAIIESTAATSQLTNYQESSINTFNISGYTLNRTVSLFNTGLVTIPAGISVPAQGSWLGDVNGRTMDRMLISPDANWLNNLLLVGQNPSSSANWVTNITGNPTHDDDMIILNNSFIPSSNTVNYSAQADLNNFIGTGNLSSSFSSIISTSLAGSANLTFGQRLARSYFYKVTYTYDCGLAPTSCYKPAVTDGNTYPTKHGITSLGRAGTDSDNWPMVRQSAWTALESKTKGFVVNRVKFNASNQPVANDGTTLVITSPVEGMMVYDTTNNCLKVYTSNDGGSSFAWHCMSTQACPQ